ncbi:MAG TPA: NrsF family protein [Xanthobacteraceae bacterium]
MAPTSQAQSRHEAVILKLTAELEPVRRLPPPGRRSLLWLSLVAAIAFTLAAVADRPAVAARLAAAPDMWLSLIGSALTMVLAAVAAFELSLPDRSERWALLPLPPALLWLGASGAGCLRAWLVPDTHAADFNDTKDCLAFILALSVPLSALLLGMLRRGHTLRPNLTAAVAGFASAAAAATLLVFFHPYDASATDVAVHVAAVTLVIFANRAYGGRMLRAEVS